MPEQPEQPGFEKRGVVAPGWTPGGSDQDDPDDLSDHLSKRAADSAAGVVKSARARAGDVDPAAGPPAEEGPREGH